MTPLFRIPVVPCPAPRMTQRDRWKTRPCVRRYHQFRDAVNEHRLRLGLPHDALPERLTLVSFVPMPKSKTKKWKSENVWEAHRNKPDVDNLLKAFLDAWFRDADTDDSHIWDARSIKVWCPEGQGAIEVYEAEKLRFERD